MFQQTARKHLADILKDRYPANARGVERVIAATFTREDMDQVLSLATDLYRAGFDQAAVSYRDQLKKLGYDVRISHAD